MIDSSYFAHSESVDYHEQKLGKMPLFLSSCKRRLVKEDVKVLGFHSAF